MSIAVDEKDVPLDDTSGFTLGTGCLDGDLPGMAVEHAQAVVVGWRGGLSL